MFPAALLLGVACVDYDLAGPSEPPPVADPHPPGAGAAVVVSERCDGLDDDGDGLVDEGWPDVDADGTADCLDGACAAAAGSAAGVEVDAACERLLPEAAELAAGLVVEAEWWDLPADDRGTGWQEPPLILPVGPASDPLDVEASDLPSMLIRDGLCVPSLVRPADRTLRWRAARGDTYNCGAALCDLEGSGGTDLLLVSMTIPPAAGCTSSCLTWHVERREAATGRVVWTSPVDWSLQHTWMNLLAPECVDVDADGVAEIVTLGGVFSAADGSRLAAFEEPELPTIYWNVATADVDLDGDYEVAMHGQLRAADGSTVWDSGLRARVHYTMVVQGDDDDEGEILLVSSDGLFLHDTGGELLASNPADFGGYDLEWPARPCAADFDGDGRQDFAVARGGEVRAWDRDLRELWSSPGDVLVDGAACVAWDLDGDGAHELLVNGGESFTIYSGRDGEVLLQDPGRYEWASVSSPVPVDLDRDGSAEIVVASMNVQGDPVLKVWAHPGNLLPQGPLSWPVEQYHATNVGPLGEVPSTPPRYWLDNGGLFRGYPAGEHPGADLAVEVADSCQSSTWPGVGTVSVTGLVTNRGPLDAPDAHLVALAADGSELASADLGAVASGEGVPFALDFALAPACGGEVTLGVTSSAAQCDDTNDTATLPELDCSGG